MAEAITPPADKVAGMPGHPADHNLMNVAIESLESAVDTAEGTLATTVTDLNTAEATLATTVTDLNTAEATLATTVTDLNTAELKIANQSWFNVKDYGAVGNGTADDTAALTAAITAANAVAGTVFLPPGIFKFNGSLTLGTHTKLRGSGIETSTLKAGNSSSVLIVGSGTTITYTLVEHVLLNGDGLTPRMLYIKKAFQSTFRSIRIEDTIAGSEAMRLEGAQNCLFDKVTVSAFTGDGFRAMTDTAGHVFIGFKCSSARNANSRHMVLDSPEAGPITNPQNFTFIGGHFEAPHSAQIALIRLGDCANILFEKTEINGDGGNTGPLRLIECDLGAKRIKLIGCNLQGGNGTDQTIGVYLMDTLTTNVSQFEFQFLGGLRIDDLGAFVRLDDSNHYVEVLGHITQPSAGLPVPIVTTGDASKIKNFQSGPLVVEAHSAGTNLLELVDVNENTVFAVDETGTVTGGDGGVPVGGWLTPAVSTVDVTVTNSTSLVNVVTVTGLIDGAKYLAIGTMIYTAGTTTSKAKVGFNVPGVSDIIWNTGGLLSTATTDEAGDIEREAWSSVTGRPVGGTAGNPMLADMRAIITCTQDGDLSLRIAQNTAEPGISAVAKAGTCLTVQRIA